jgi:hypothetical protein
LRALTAIRSKRQSDFALLQDTISLIGCRSCSADTDWRTCDRRGLLQPEYALFIA